MKRHPALWLTILLTVFFTLLGNARITSGDGEQTGGLTPKGLLNNSTVGMGPTVMTNQFPTGTGVQGGAVVNQRVGGNAPLGISGYVPLNPADGQIAIGSPNQWRFYVLNNEQGYTNAAFCTFSSASLASADFTSTASNSVWPM